MNPLFFVRLTLTSMSDRLRRSRPGSVLIMVIVLLLLLAIMGAAFISTTRSSRVASAQNVMNADVDLMLDGISKVCEGIIVDDLNDNYGNLNGINAGATQGVHSVYRGAYDSSQTYNPGDIVSYPAPAATPPFTPPQFYIATTKVIQPPITKPALGATTPWLQTTHVPGITSSLIQPWLAERIPTPDGFTGTPPRLAYWPNISQMAVPVGGTLATSILGIPFESPDGTIMPTLSAGSTLVGQIGTNLVPTFKSMGNIYVPALEYGGTQYVAGDADGDGIADSLLFRIPGTNNDGLTWYAAVRIIDNNSAINLNTALSRDSEYALSGGTLTISNSNYYSLFATSVGLAELLHPGDSPKAASGNFANFNAYRIGAGATIQPQADAAPGGANPLLPVTRPDIQFLNAGDLLSNQLIRRIANPGFNGNGNRCATFPLSDEAALAYRFCLVNPETASSQVSASLSENLLPFSLASWVPTAGSSPQYYRSVPFGNNGTPSDTDVNQWFNDNFNYDSPAGTADYDTEPQPVRALLVTRNPVSNAITPVYDFDAKNSAEPLEPLGGPLGAVSNPYTAPANTIPGMMLPYGTGPQNYVHFKGVWNQSQVSKYQFNDIVVGGDGHTYIFVNPPTVSLPTDHTSAVWVNSPTLENLPPSSKDITTGLGLYQYWQFQPWSKTPVKTNVNTATFRELYRAFWSVMAGNPSNQTPFGTSVDLNPYWLSASASQPNPQHQFRSPLRDPTYNSSTPNNVTRLDPENTMLLRAALAAVNALGLRDASQNIISRTVYLKAMIAPGAGQAAIAEPVMVRVYSNAPQPVISEVYVNSYRGRDSGDPTILNDRGYVAVELYNPYSVPMVLQNWQLGLIDRSGTGYPKLTFVENPDASKPPGTVVSVIASPNQSKFTLQAQNDPRIDPKTNKFDLPKPVGGVIILPAHGYALLENYNADPNATPPGNSGDAFGRPASAGFVLTNNQPVQKTPWFGPGGQENPNTCDVYVPGLQLVIPGASGSTLTKPSTSPGGELVLLRPRRSDGTLTSSGTPTDPSAHPPVAATDDPLDTFDEGIATDPNLYDLVPVDSFDFTGLQPLGGQDDPGQAWSYVRTKGDFNQPDTWFRQIYPGRYSVTDATTPREAGTDHHAVLPAENPWRLNATPKFGNNVLAGNSCYTNNFPPIQIYNTYNTYDTAYAANTVQAHWANPTVYLSIPTTDTGSVQVASASYAQYPYGAFARNGDMFDITFIGAYRISQVSATINPNPAEPTNFVELNSLPRDCSFADATYADSDVADQKYENIGRFCPIQARPAPVLPAKWLQPDYYAWTSDFYSYLTVQALPDAMLPNFDTNISDVASEHPFTNPSPPPIATPYYKYAPSSPTSPPSTPPPAPLPAMVLTANPTASDQTDQGNVGVDGLININTASWKVLSMLPMITKNEDPGGTAPNYNFTKDNESLAKAIVSWRINHGPFTSIYDLNSVVDGASGTNGLQNAEGHLNIANGGAASGVSSLNGIMSPPDPAFPSATPGGKASGLSEDYQSDFAMLSRISNLITTRSDTFTIYIEIQGWQNVGTANAQPMITRHYAYIVDRSAINGDPSSRFLKTLTVPND